jgi:hypothetical protein
MHTIFNELIDEWDEIASIEYVGEEETIDINTTGNRLFYANDILTHNSAVDEIEFDHSHISGGISKINTADNVFGIFTSRSMRERGQYQLQLMKTRSSSGVGQKIDLVFNLETLRITDESGEETRQAFSAPPKPNPTSILGTLKTSSTVAPSSDNVDADTGEILDDVPVKRVVADAQGSKLKGLLANLKQRG